MQTATFGGGCFWCTEAVFQNLNGVEKVISGYMGGHLKHPTYMEICEGNTGHAEVIQINFDEQKISFETLLLVFFKTHNPTTLNQQGNDIGTQYRSVIFYHDVAQQLEAQNLIDLLSAEEIFDRKIITEISPLETFYPAEDYHQNYFNLNKNKPYCTYVIQPKIDKLIATFRDQLKA